MDNEILGRYFLNLDQRLLERVTGEGNRIRPDYWRRGVNRAARRLMFTYAFTELGANAYETAISAFSVLSITRVSRTRYLSLINQHLIYLENRNYKAYFDDTQVYEGTLISGVFNSIFFRVSIYGFLCDPGMTRSAPLLASMGCR